MARRGDEESKPLKRGGSPTKRARRISAERGLHEPGAWERGKDYSVVLTPEICERVVTFVRAGNFFETAAAASGVSRHVLRGWLDKGGRVLAALEAGRTTLLETDREIDDEMMIYAMFTHRIHEAQAIAKAADVAAIRNAGRDHEHVTEEFEPSTEVDPSTGEPLNKLTKRTVRRERGDWRAIAWRLEHMHGDEFTMKVRVEVEQQLNAALDYLEQTIPPEAYRHVVEALAARART